MVQLWSENGKPITYPQEKPFVYVLWISSSVDNQEPTSAIPIKPEAPDQEEVLPVTPNT